MSPTNAPLSSNALALQDSILLRDISVNATVGLDRWGKVRAQPVLISVRLSLSLVEAATNDDLDKTINYGLLTKDILKVAGKEFRSVFELARAVLTLIRETVSDGRLVSAFVNVEASNQFLTAHSIVSTNTYDAAKDSSTETITIKDLQLYTIIGVNPPERVHKQSVVTNVVFHGVHWEDPSWLPRAVAAITQVIEASSYLTIESFVQKIASVACFLENADVVTVRMEKPSAIVMAYSSGVEVTRDRAFFTSSAP